MKADAFLDKLMTRASRAGLQAAEAYMVSGENTRVAVFEGEVSESSLSVSMGVSFRAMLGGRIGYASTEAADDEAIDMLIERAKDNARTVKDEDEQFIFAPDGAYPAVEGSFEPSLAAAASPAKLIEGCLAMECAAKAEDSRVLRMAYCIGGYGSGQTRILNTRGLDVCHDDNLAYYMAVPVVKDGDAMVSGEHFFAGNNPAGLDPTTVGRLSALDAIGYIGASSVPGGLYPAVFRRDAWARLLATFAGVFSAESAHRGLSLLKGKEGRAIANPLVTLTDDPLLPRGYASRPFDDEGVPARRKNVIEGGTLTTLLHNLKSANRQGVKTTGNASKGGYTAPVSISPFNFYLQPGENAPEQLFRHMDRGLLLCELSGLHSGANPVTGDFSLLAKGFFIERGQVGRPVNQITVAGNFYELLNKIAMLGNDLWFDLPSGSGAYGGPSVLVDGLSIAGQ